jgi:hypothetical protein
VEATLLMRSPQRLDLRPSWMLAMISCKLNSLIFATAKV